MLALCLMLSGTYYAKNYAGIIGRGLDESLLSDTMTEKQNYWYGCNITISDIKGFCL